MSFFLKGKPRKSLKRKFDVKLKKNKKTLNGPTKEESDNESIDSDLDFKDVPDRSESEGEYETAQEKKVRLAKKYLEEIVKEERERTENDDLDRTLINKRLKEDYLELQGKLHRNVADKCIVPSLSDFSVLRCKENRQSVTCLCISSDGQTFYSGSKCASIIKWSLIEKKKLATVLFRKGCKNDTKFECHSTPIAALAISTDEKFLVSCEQNNDIQVWSATNLKHLHTFKGHRDVVTDLVFRKDTHQLFSASKDRSVKVWSLDEMAYVETMFGHQAPITAIDALSRERAVTAGGRDTTVRVWKVAEESQLIFNGHSGSIDCIKMIDEEHFVSCGEDGALNVWGTTKKKPLCSASQAHGLEDSMPRWITSVSAMLNTDLIASGSHDGFIRLWKLSPGCRRIEPIFEVPVIGFVNSLSFSPDGSQVLAAVGQEHKLARWWKVKEAKNAIYIIPISKSNVKT